MFAFYTRIDQMLGLVSSSKSGTVATMGISVKKGPEKSKRSTVKVAQSKHGKKTTETFDIDPWGK